MEVESTVQTETEEESKTEKRTRKRKKKLHKAVKTQMEFYFSDSNLMKDKYLGKLLAENKEGWIPLEVFFHFNRIRSLNCTMKDICKAISGSDVLEISSDGKSVRRLTAVSVKENVDQCTLYVEHLPPNVDHDWLQNVFSPFGLIDYISLPRFKQKGTVKGFAFVEFSRPEEALKACKHFGHIEEETKHDAEESVEQTPKSKRKRGTSESEDSGKKRVRQSSISDTSGKESALQVPTLKTEESVTKEPEQEEMVEDEKIERKKKKRTRKKKRKSLEQPEKPLLAIRVMPKEEWKRWKNKYLSMQKATMSQLKMSLSGVEAPSFPSKECKEQKQQQSVNNDQQPATDSQDEANVKLIRKKDKPIKFMEGTVLKIKFTEPVSNSAEMKGQLRSLGSVAYVELNEGEKIAYVRCDSAEESQRILSEVELPGKARLLKGAEETSYWEKLKSDRELKLNSQNKRKRGTKKVLTKVVKKHNTHIKFENE